MKKMKNGGRGVSLTIAGLLLASSALLAGGDSVYSPAKLPADGNGPNLGCPNCSSVETEQNSTRPPSNQRQPIANSATRASVAAAPAGKISVPANTGKK